MVVVRESAVPEGVIMTTPSELAIAVMVSLPPDAAPSAAAASFPKLPPQPTRLEARQQVGYSAIIFFVFIFARMPFLF